MNEAYIPRETGNLVNQAATAVALHIYDVSGIKGSQHGIFEIACV